MAPKRKEMVGQTKITAFFKKPKLEGGETSSSDPVEATPIKSKSDPPDLTTPLVNSPSPEPEDPRFVHTWTERLGNSWFLAVKQELKREYFKNCMNAVEKERCCGKQVYPPARLVFNAFKSTPLEKVRVVIVGQDPYHQPNQAMGLSFAVPRGILKPPSLRNIYKEIGIDSQVLHGDLSSWASQGVFLLNSSLTVEESRPNSHKEIGWVRFTDHAISVVNRECKGVIFLLWGRDAKLKGKQLDRKRHLVLEANHPSPLSANSPPQPFIGCGHFRKVNEIFRERGEPEIQWNPDDWQIQTATRTSLP